MNIVAFNGSPRTGGNTDLLLESALSGIDRRKHRIDIFRLNEMNIAPCQNCGGCTETGICVVEDKMQQIYPAIRDADRVILASPIYFFALSAQTKIMIDRCQPFWFEKYIHNRTLEKERGPHRHGLLILVGGMRRQVGVDCASASATAFFRTISVQEHATLFYLGVDLKGAIREHPTALQEALEAGKKLVNL